MQPLLLFMRNASTIVAALLPLPLPSAGQLNPNFSAGSFQLPIAEISTYLAEPVTPRLVHVSSAGVTRPNRPGINVDQVCALLTRRIFFVAVPAATRS